MAKRLFDLIISVLGLVILLPFFALIALLVKANSSGPVFYRGTRAGRFGRPFRIWKFRTMKVDPQGIGPSSTPVDDPRITRVGQILRKHKLDELPQILNVIRGEMSLVGPRPQFLWATNLYSEAEREILKVRPGMTGIASLRFADEGEILRGSLDPDRDYLEKIHPEKLRLERHYVRTRSLGLDCKIILRTFVALVPGRKQSDHANQEFTKANLHSNS